MDCKAIHLYGKCRNLRFRLGFGAKPQRFFLPRTRDFKHLLDHLVEKLRFDCVGGAVIDLFALAAGNNQSRRARGRRWCDSAGEDISMHSES